MISSAIRDFRLGIEKAYQRDIVFVTAPAHPSAPWLLLVEADRRSIEVSWTEARGFSFHGEQARHLRNVDAAIDEVLHLTGRKPLQAAA